MCVSHKEESGPLKKEWYLFLKLLGNRYYGHKVCLGRAPSWDWDSSLYVGFREPQKSSACSQNVQRPVNEHLAAMASLPEVADAQACLRSQGRKQGSDRLHVRGQPQNASVGKKAQTVKKSSKVGWRGPQGLEYWDRRVVLSSIWGSTWKPQALLHNLPSFHVIFHGEHPSLT